MKMILDERGKKYVLKPGEEFQSDLGIIKADVLDDAEIGDEVKSHLDHTFKIMKPNVNDFIDIMDRRCSILIQKDITLESQTLRLRTRTSSRASMKMTSI